MLHIRKILVRFRMQLFKKPKSGSWPENGVLTFFLENFFIFKIWPQDGGYLHSDRSVAAYCAPSMYSCEQLTFQNLAAKWREIESNVSSTLSFLSMNWCLLCSLYRTVVPIVQNLAARWREIESKPSSSLSVMSISCSYCALNSFGRKVTGNEI
jgi:hypothetical protein